MYEFCYDYVRPKYEKKTYVNMITDIFIVYTKAEDIYIDIAKDVKTKFETSN